MNDTRPGLPELLKARRAGAWLLSAVFVFSIFVNLLMLTGPLFMLQVYDRVLGSGSEETLVALFVLVAALYALMMSLEYARGRILARFGARFQSKLDDRVFSAVLRRALVPKERSAPANGLQDLEAVRTLFSSPVMIALFDVPWTPLFVMAIFMFHPWLGWMAVFGSVVLITITLLNNVLTKAKTFDAQVASHKAQAVAEQARRSAEVVRAQGMSDAMTDRWWKLRNAALEHAIKASDWNGVSVAASKSFRLFLQSAMLALGAYLVLRGELTAGAMVASSILLGRGLAPIELALGQWGMVQHAKGAWTSLKTLLETTPAQVDTHVLPRPHANIACQGVSVLAPGSKSLILNGVSFYLGAGEVMGVIGSSGSGKTTLAKSLLGLNARASGDIRLGGATLDQYDPDALGSYVGYLPQNVTLFSGTVGENIARMSTQPNGEKVLEAAKRANAHETILKLPNGYDTMVEGNEGQLSGGQRQRIALARAFYGDPVLLILDEPNSALDNDGSMALNAAIREFKADNRAVIIMTHRPSAISECTRLMVIEGGRTKAEGPRDEVLRSMVANEEDIQGSLVKLRAS